MSATPSVPPTSPSTSAYSPTTGGMSRTVTYMMTAAIAAVTRKVAMVTPMILPARLALCILAIDDEMEQNTVGTAMQNIRFREHRAERLEHGRALVDNNRFAVNDFHDCGPDRANDAAGDDAGQHQDQKSVAFPKVTLFHVFSSCLFTSFKIASSRISPAQTIAAGPVRYRFSMLPSFFFRVDRQLTTVHADADVLPLTLPRSVSAAATEPVPVPQASVKSSTPRSYVFSGSHPGRSARKS